MTYVANVANAIVETVGCGAVLVSGGSGRSASDTDQVVAIRSLLGQARPQSSDLVLGPVEVKGNWQLKLVKGDSIELLLRDPRKRKQVELALQQLFGDMVEDEAPFGMLSTYEAIVFLARHPDVLKKTLFCSRIYWQDEGSPSLIAATCTFLDLCWKGRALKDRLPRDDVPVTSVAGYTVAQLPTSTTRGRVTRPLPFSVKAPTPRPTSGKRKRRATSLEDFQVTSFGSIGYKGTLVASGRHGNLIFGSINGEPVVIKKYELRRRASADALEREFALYTSSEYAALQGQVIPRLIKYGLLPHSGTPFLALSYEGAPLEDTARTPAIVAAATSALDRFHAARLLHGDLSLNNLLVDKDHVILCDFESVQETAPEEDQLLEKKLLLELVAEAEETVR
ncbi:hypothetical protein KFL_003020180 [Klebsormidium nitens]|uniref:Uncharacterized protein n=1 Tax=Klebsormidium nitens TaxID=105231 RepID=A0A0U9HMY5_KLENI|nr:hypothetical protein KFL_003020180 [Klebsormidium nitens]|eukprot:GAQ86656.1 hypothetical protein KFL_003020180 [Klebsormidium nitens]